MTPFAIDFIKNNPEYSFRFNTMIDNGANEIVTVTVEEILPPPVTLQFNTPYGCVDFETTNSSVEDIADLGNMLHATSVAAEITSQLSNKLCNNYLLNKHYTMNVYVDVNDGKAKVNFTDKNRITRNNILFVQYRRGITILLGNKVSYFLINAGRSPVELSNFKVIGKFRVSRKQDFRGNYLPGPVQTVKVDTPEFVLDVIDGVIHIDTKMLLSYFYPPDIPHWNEAFAAYALDYNTIAVELLLAKHYNNQTHFWRSFANNVLINGKVKHNKFLLNEPDWLTHNSYQGQISQYNNLINWGIPKLSMSRVHRDTIQYLYIANFTSADLPAYTQLQCCGNSGTVSNIELAALTIPAGKICRIPINFNNLYSDISNTIYMFVNISTDIAHVNNIISKKYIFCPKPYYSREMLLQNFLGLLENFTIENTKTSREMEGKQVVVSNQELIDIANSSTTITARTGWKTKEEMQLLADALQNEHSYVLEGKVAYPINFLSKNITICDEEQDLQSGEIDFSLSDPISMFTQTELTIPVIIDDEVILR